jgi:CRP-like cAMP-binding protein
MGAMGKVGATEIEDMHLTWKKNTGQVSVVGTSKPDGPTGWKGKPLQRSLDGRILRENGWRGMATLVYHWFHFPAAGVLRRHSAGTTVMNADDTHHDTQRARAFERAAELLTAPNALMHLNLDEARVVVGYMTPRFIPAETTFIREGDAADDGFMALLLEGEIVVESVTVSRTEPLTISVLGPGALVGEVGLVDREPRSASCTTGIDSLCAILTRESFEALINEQPRIGSKLLLAISARLAERLRDNARKLRLYAKLAKAMQMEIDRLVLPKRT